MKRATKWRKVAGILAFGAVAVTLTLGSAVGQTPEPFQDPLAELKARLDKLEKDNAALKKQLEGKKDGPYKAEDVEKKEKEKINKQIDSYMKDREKKDKEKKEKEEKKKEEEGFEVGKQLDFKARWNNGLWFETEDKAFRVHVGGRTQIDGVWVHAPKNVMGPQGNTPGIGEFDDGVNFRRARLAIEGTFWEVLDFNCEYDFLNTQRFVPGGNVLAGRTVGGTQINPQTLNNLIGTVADRQNVENVPVPTDLWIQWTKIPYVGNMRIGNHKPWISFEHLTSSRFLDFMERSMAFDAFVENGNNGFIPGISVWNNYADNHIFVGGGVYKPNFRDIYGWNVGDGEYLYNARVAATPIYQENGRCLVHVGLGYQHSTADDGVLRMRARTQLRNGPAVLHNIISIIQLQGHDLDLFVPELAINYGPFNLSAEWYACFVNQRPGEVFQNVANQTANLPTGGRGSLFYQGGYITMGYFLTGEHRAYNNLIKSWDRQPVNEAAFFVDGDDGKCCGRGAWEVLARYSWLNLDDKGVNGGIINAFTVGLNWYLNPNAKIQFNYDIGYRNVTAYNGNAIAFAAAAPQAFGLTAFDGMFQGFGTRFAFDF
jgi:phosphate-selective porin OprO/OprP